MATKEESDDIITGFSRRRVAEISGVGLCAVAFYILLSLISHNSADPSWNHSSTADPTNMGGIVGAFISDVLLQFVGLAGVLAALVPAVWGWRLVTGRRIIMWSMRFTMLIISLPLVASLLAMIESPLSYPYAEGLGGSIGRLVHDKLSPFFTTAGFAVFALIMSAVTLWAAFGLSLREWATASAMLVRTLRLPLKTLGLLRRGGDNTDEAADRWWHKLMFWRKAEDAEDESEEDDSDEETAEQPKRKRAPRRQMDKPIEKSHPKLPAKEAQASMELKKGTSRAKKGSYQFPPLTLLATASSKTKKNQLSESALAQNARLLESVLKDFGVNGEITKVRPGPVVTLYELEPAAGTKSARVVGLADDIARSMSAISARVAVIPGRNAIGIELPNTTRETVYLRELLEGEEFLSNEAKLPLALGKDIGGTSIVVDLTRMPHLLVAGTTGSGKSVAVNTMIMSLIYHLTPEQCKFIMIDPKMLELSAYDNIPHLLSPVVTEPGKAVVALKWTVKEMENRYRLMSNLGVRNIDGYNKRIAEAGANGETLTRTVQTGFDPETGKPIIEEQPLDMTPLPYIVVVVDEMADLMLVAGKEIESSVQRLAQMARAAGIHIIMATQRPSVDVITGVIKANFPTRISFQVTSRIDSRTILGEQGAEQLLGQGDMLYMAGGGRIMRVHGPFVSDKEVEKIVAHVKLQGTPTYVEEVTIDTEAEAEMLGGESEEGEDNALYEQAKAIVLRDRKASTSYIQRHLKIGYNRAARLVDRMEREGIVGAANHVGKREVLMR